MAVGDIYGDTPWYRAIKILENATVANSPPVDASPATVVGGIDLRDVHRPYFAHRDSSIAVFGTVTGSTVGVVTLRLWGYIAAQGRWAPVGKGTDADKGKINDGNTIGETGTDTIAHVEPFVLLGHFDRLYLEVLSPGNLTDLDAWLIVPRLPDGQG